ncbi:MAG: 5-formyltetrahydrofolate cyclo-ligase [Alphaproteobacteria bacterium]|nr:5-formyltetrahydrofolate cyclo-ligase [Alphaproteobacteria bacterium]
MLKEALRAHMKDLRERIAPDEALAAEQAVWEHVRTLDGTVLVYVSIGTELPTRRLLGWMIEAGMSVAVPRITGQRAMEAAALGSTEALVPGGFRVPTSEGPVVAVDHVLVPGLAFDRHGARLGYGAGFYDVWLAHHTGVDAIGLGYLRQVVDAVPTEGHDAPLQRLLTEAGWLTRS